MENENIVLKDKLRKLDITNVEFKNLINKTPFSSFIEGDSVIRRNAIDSFVSNNFYEFDKESEDGQKSIEVQEVIKFDDGSTHDPIPPLELSFRLKK